MNLSTLEHFFKPETRAAAQELVRANAVYLKIGSDTQVEASIRGTTPVQVIFRSTSIERPSFEADCSCKVGKKNQLCKHVWATLVVATEKQPDFFAEKVEIEKSDLLSKREDLKAPPTEEARARQTAYEEKQAAFQQKQNEYRKQAYQAQKARAKERTESSQTRAEDRTNLSSASAPSKANLFLPDTVQEALGYFEQNGFTMSLPINDEDLHSAKRVLSRVFHPDKGGTQEEMLELLRHADALSKHR